MSKTIIDLSGRRFGRWVVISKSGKRHNQTYWWCRCDCGTLREVNPVSLKNARSTSCGCYKRELMKKRDVAHSKTHSVEYNTWTRMKNRCCNHKSSDYKHYGGRGIKVCDKWVNSFESFLADMGKRPKGMSIDRIDVNGDYCPENCRWADNITQMNNRTNNKYLTYKSQTKTMSEWAREKGLSPGTLLARLKRGWSIEESLETRLIETGKVFKRTRGKSQNELIKEHLLNRDTITPLKALEMYNCTRLASRIHALRMDGMVIKSKINNSSGDRCIEYFL